MLDLLREEDAEPTGARLDVAHAGLCVRAELPALLRPPTNIEEAGDVSRDVSPTVRVKVPSVCVSVSPSIGEATRQCHPCWLGFSGALCWALFSERR